MTIERRDVAFEHRRIVRDEWARIVDCVVLDGAGEQDEVEESEDPHCVQKGVPEGETREFSFYPHRQSYHAVCQSPVVPSGCQ